MLVFVCLSVLYHNITSLNVGELDIEVVGYDVCILQKYHGNESKVKVFT